MNDLELYHNGEKVKDLVYFLRNELCDFEIIAFVKRLIINMYERISTERIGDNILPLLKDEILDFVDENFDDDEKISIIGGVSCGTAMAAKIVKSFCESDEKINNFCFALDDESVAKIVENLRYYKRI